MTMIRLETNGGIAFEANGWVAGAQAIDMAPGNTRVRGVRTDYHRGGTLLSVWWSGPTLIEGVAVDGQQRTMTLAELHELVAQ